MDTMSLLALAKLKDKADTKGTYPELVSGKAIEAENLIVNKVQQLESSFNERSTANSLDVGKIAHLKKIKANSGYYTKYTNPHLCKNIADVEKGKYNEDGTITIRKRINVININFDDYSMTKNTDFTFFDSKTVNANFRDNFVGSCVWKNFDGNYYYSDLNHQYKILSKDEVAVQTWTGLSGIYLYGYYIFKSNNYVYYANNSKLYYLVGSEWVEINNSPSSLYSICMFIKNDTAYIYDFKNSTFYIINEETHSLTKYTECDIKENLELSSTSFTQFYHHNNTLFYGTIGYYDITNNVWIKTANLNLSNSTSFNGYSNIKVNEDRYYARGYDLYVLKNGKCDWELVTETEYYAYTYKMFEFNGRYVQYYLVNSGAGTGLPNALNYNLKVKKGTYLLKLFEPGNYKIDYTTRNLDKGELSNIYTFDKQNIELKYDRSDEFYAQSYFWECNGIQYVYYNKLIYTFNNSTLKYKLSSNYTIGAGEHKIWKLNGKVYMGNSRVFNEVTEDWEKFNSQSLSEDNIFVLDNNAYLLNISSRKTYKLNQDTNNWDLIRDDKDTGKFKYTGTYWSSLTGALTTKVWYDGDTYRVSDNTNTQLIFNKITEQWEEITYDGLYPIDGSYCYEIDGITICLSGLNDNRKSGYFDRVTKKWVVKQIINSSLASICVKECNGKILITSPNSKNYSTSSRSNLTMDSDGFMRLVVNSDTYSEYTIWVYDHLIENEYTFTPIIVNLTELYGDSIPSSNTSIINALPQSLLMTKTKPGQIYKDENIPKKIVTTGFNLFDYKKGYMKTISGHYYEILGNYTAVYFSKTFDGDKSTLSISTKYYNQNSKQIASYNGFLASSDGYIFIDGCDSTTCVHLVHSGYYNGRTETYVEREYNLPQLSSFFAIDDYCDEVDFVNKKIIKRIGVKPYELGDELSYIVNSTLTKSYYVLEHEEIIDFIDSDNMYDSLGMIYFVDDYGYEKIVFENDDSSSTINTLIDYEYNMIDEISNFQFNYVNFKSLSSIASTLQSLFRNAGLGYVNISATNGTNGLQLSISNASYNKSTGDQINAYQITITNSDTQKTANVDGDYDFITFELICKDNYYHFFSDYSDDGFTKNEIDGDYYIYDDDYEGPDDPNNYLFYQHLWFAVNDRADGDDYWTYGTGKINGKIGVFPMRVVFGDFLISWNEYYYNEDTDEWEASGQEDELPSCKCYIYLPDGTVKDMTEVSFYIKRLYIDENDKDSW